MLAIYCRGPYSLPESRFLPASIAWSIGIALAEEGRTWNKENEKKP